MKKLIFLFSFMSLLISCNKENKSKNIVSLYNIFQTTDSLNLSFPDTLFPKRIEDIVLTKEYLYLLNLNFTTKYPLLKLNRKGHFIKTIGKIGNGPKEMKFLPFKISGEKNILVAGSPTLNTFYIFRNDTLNATHSFLSNKIKFSDLKILNGKNILCTSYGKTKYHLTILDSNLNIKYQYIKMPESTGLATLAGFLNFYAITGNNKNIYTQYCYPPNIYKIKFDKFYSKIENIELIYKGAGLNEYSRPNYHTILSDFQKGKLRKLDVFKKFSRIHLIYKEKNYLLGIYLTSFGKTAKKYAFILNNNRLVKEVQIPNEDTKGLFVYDNGIARSIYYNEDGVLKVKLYFLELNKKYINSITR